MHETMVTRAPSSTGEYKAPRWVASGVWGGAWVRHCPVEGEVSEGSAGEGGLKATVLRRTRGLEEACRLHGISWQLLHHAVSCFEVPRRHCNHLSPQPSCCPAEP